MLQASWRDTPPCHQAWDAMWRQAYSYNSSAGMEEVIADTFFADLISSFNCSSCIPLATFLGSCTARFALYRVL